jgi:hypothetical protein
MIEVQPKTRDIPIWLTGVVLILCVVGGGWLVRWYTRDPGAQAIEVPLEDPATAAAAAKFRGPLAGYAPGGSARPQRDGSFVGNVVGVRAFGNSGNAWIVRSGEATMHVSVGRKGEVDLNPSYVQQKLTPEQAQVLLMRRRLMTDATMREQIQLSAQQLDALGKVAEFRGMVIEPADRAKLTTLFQAWRAKPGDATEKPLVAALVDVAKRAAEPTKAFDSSRVEQVRKILTPEQVKRFNEGPTPQNAAPATPPAAPAAKPVVGTPAAAGRPGAPG